ncbi:MAG TPA: murein biosynthesis integral membrane protein MurJ [Verrucomicrobiae bacterium]|jgi:putative peptidoglycan lipid II flippase|nr:murein biosynthesis integral membrane protein MurJ [Verrucomicrobiae bacterium]
MLKSSGSMAFATLTSRLLGMVREIVYAKFMGDGWVAAAFQVAFTIPNLFRRLLGEGALTAAFIPVFKEKEKTAGEKEMWRAANAVISGLIISASIIIVLVLIGISIVLGVHQFSAQTDLMLRLLRWMFPYMLLVCLAAACMGMLNARGHFFIPAMGATMLNVVMIASVLFVAPHWGKVLHEQIFALALGVLVAGVAQAAFQMPTLLHDGFRYRWVSPWKNETVKRVVRQMIPGALGVAAFQINVAIIQFLGLWLDRPEQPLIAPFNYAVRLMELPQGVFGISLATFLLPTLAGLAAEKNYGEFRKTLRHGMAYLIFVNLLMTVLLITLAEPIIRLLFERGKFDHGSTLRATFALECLAGSLVAYSLVNILARAFYALGDTKTPMKVSLVCLGVNLILSVSLVFVFRQGGLGLANTVSSLINVLLLLYALKKKLGKLELKPLKSTILPLAIAVGIATGIALFASHWWELRTPFAGFRFKLGAVFVPGALAGIAYWIVAYGLKVPAAKEISDLIFGRFLKSKTH